MGYGLLRRCYSRYVEGFNCESSGFVLAKIFSGCRFRQIMLNAESAAVAVDEEMIFFSALCHVALEPRVANQPVGWGDVHSKQFFVDTPSGCLPNEPVLFARLSFNMAQHCPRWIGFSATAGKRLPFRHELHCRNRLRFGARDPDGWRIGMERRGD